MLGRASLRCFANLLRLRSYALASFENRVARSIADGGTDVSICSFVEVDLEATVSEVS